MCLLPLFREWPDRERRTLDPRLTGGSVLTHFSYSEDPWPTLPSVPNEPLATTVSGYQERWIPWQMPGRHWAFCQVLPFCATLGVGT